MVTIFSREISSHPWNFDTRIKDSFDATNGIIRSYVEGWRESPVCLVSSEVRVPPGSLTVW